jgi:hypothetical protein
MSGRLKSPVVLLKVVQGFFIHILVLVCYKESFALVEASDRRDFLKKGNNALITNYRSITILNKLPKFLEYKNFTSSSFILSSDSFHFCVVLLNQSLLQ